MRLRPIPVIVFLLGAAALIGGWWMFQRTEAGRYNATRNIALSRSELRLEMKIAYARGPLVSEQYTLSDIDGLSSMQYTATNRDGTTVHVAAQSRKTKNPQEDVAVLFGEAQQDGIWDLSDRPPRGDANAVYTISVYQLEAGQHGSHRFTFTDPHYWATTAGRQYQITLGKNSPVPDLVNLKSSALADPRYQKVVDDFRTFGTPKFRATVAAQRAKLLGHR